MMMPLGMKAIYRTDDEDDDIRSVTMTQSKDDFPATIIARKWGLRNKIEVNQICWEWQLGRWRYLCPGRSPQMKPLMMWKKLWWQILRSRLQRSSMLPNVETPELPKPEVADLPDVVQSRRWYCARDIEPQPEEVNQETSAPALLQNQEEELISEESRRSQLINSGLFLHF